MLHNIVLSWTVFFGVLAAILETLGLKNHCYEARTLSAVIIAVWSVCPLGLSQLVDRSDCGCGWLCLFSDTEAISRPVFEKADVIAAQKKTGRMQPEISCVIISTEHGEKDRNRFCLNRRAVKQQKIQPLQLCFFSTSPFREILPATDPTSALTMP